MKIEKRDGRQEEFNKEKIIAAIKKSTNGIVSIDDFEISAIAKDIQIKFIELEQTGLDELKKGELECNEKELIISVEDIHNAVIEELKEHNWFKLALNYKTYRDERNRIRTMKTDLMKSVKAIGIETDRDNANVGNNFSSKLLRVASETQKVSNLSLMPRNLARFHEVGDLYYHDLDSYNLTTNCLHIPTIDLLKSGFNTGYGTINKPKRIGTAADLLCIIIQSCQNDMFGGQSIPDFEQTMEPFAEATRQEIEEMFDRLEVSDEVREREFNSEFIKQIDQAMQTIVYNLNTMHSRAGSQVPFSSINIGLVTSETQAMICYSFLKKYNEGMGHGEQPIFPNIIFRVKAGINREEEDPYHYLFEMACKVAAKRMNPTFMNIDADFNKEYYDKGYNPATMGCRTYLMKNVNGEPGCAGRGNIAPTTINIVRIGLLANHNIDKFFELFDEKIEQAKDSLLHRKSVLAKLKVKDLPFVAGQHLMKGSENLGPDDSIEPILEQGTWGIGFIGLAETLVALIGKHHGESKEAQELGLKIVGRLREKCDEYCETYKLNFSCYATPAEGLSGKFIVKDKIKFGLIKGVTDKEYYTNSFHVPVSFEIGMFDKIGIEAPYHKLCNGGHITYIEFDDYPEWEIVEDVIRESYKRSNISYLGINFHIRYCMHCGHYLHNEMKCPECGSQEIQGISRVNL